MLLGVLRRTLRENLYLVPSTSDAVGSGPLLYAWDNTTGLSVGIGGLIGLTCWCREVDPWVHCQIMGLAKKRPRNMLVSFPRLGIFRDIYSQSVDTIQTPDTCCGEVIIAGCGFVGYFPSQPRQIWAPKSDSAFSVPAALLEEKKARCGGLYFGGL